jgi:hypothetical protein
MFRLALILAAFACSTAFAAPPVDDTQTTQGNAPDASKPFAIKPTTATASPNQVFPPIPAFASLPPSASDDWDDAPAPAETHKGKHARHAPTRKAPADLTVHMVVSDESRGYLASVNTKLDAILQSEQRDRHLAAGGVAVAMTH